MCKATAKDSPKSLREEDQDSVKNARRSPLDCPLRKSYWRSERRLWSDECLRIFLLKIDRLDDFQLPMVIKNHLILMKIILWICTNAGMSLSWNDGDTCWRKIKKKNYEISTSRFSTTLQLRLLWVSCKVVLWNYDRYFGFEPFNFLFERIVYFY